MNSGGYIPRREECSEKVIKDKILTEPFAKQASFHVFSFFFFGGMEEIFGNQNLLFGNQKLVLNHQLTALLKKHNFGP